MPLKLSFTPLTRTLPLRPCTRPSGESAIVPQARSTHAAQALVRGGAEEAAAAAAVAPQRAQAGGRQPRVRARAGARQRRAWGLCRAGAACVATACRRVDAVVACLRLFVCSLVCFIASQHTLNQLPLQHT